MARRGELLVQSGRRVPDYGSFIGEVLGRWGVPSAIVADRWKEGELRDALDAARMPPRPLTLRGMGWRDGGEDVRRFTRAVMEARVSVARSLLLRSAMAEARVATDVAGNMKLAKAGDAGAGRRSLARDDAVAAVILAVSEGDRRGIPATGGRPRLVAV